MNLGNLSRDQLELTYQALKEAQRRGINFSDQSAAFRSVTLPTLHANQQTIKRTAKRFNAIRCGRRFGKDVLLQNLLVEPAILHGAKVGWFAPIYKDLTENWRDVLFRLRPIVKSANATEHHIDLITGGTIDMWSLSDKDSGRGRKYHRVVINEASKVRDLQYSWEYVIRPTLIDFRGDAFIGGTPKGYNYFSTLCGMHEQADDWAEYHYTTYDNPHIPRSEIDALRVGPSALPEAVFNQEILAEFVENGAYFQNVNASAVIIEHDKPDQHAGHTIALGVDWGKSNDWTVITVGCQQCGRVVDWQRFNQIDYHFQRRRLIEMCEAWRPLGVLPERNSIGEVLIEELILANVPIMRGPDGKDGFNTTALTKANLIEDLRLALVRDNFLVPRDYADELLAYEIEIRTGPPKFGAPSGLHDDRVMSLALCWRALRETYPAITGW